MKAIPRLALVASIIISCAPVAATAQESDSLKNNNLASLLNLEENQYFADRDSAYADPYYGLKKLI